MNSLFSPCRNYRQSLALLASGVLPEAERDELESHLAACADCRKYFAEIKTVTGPLAKWAKDYSQIEPDQAARNRWTRAIQAASRTQPVRRHTPATAFREWAQDVIWPYRRVWAGLAAAWVMILAGNLSLHDHPQTFTAKASAPSQEMIMAFKDRQDILAELLADHSAPREAQRPKSLLPKPRTENVRIMTT